MTERPGGPGGPRDRATRRADTLALLATPTVDCWVASASADGGPHLVPLSLAWVGERVVVAVATASATARNVTRGGTARVAVGPTRDVVVLDVELERTVPVGADDALATAYAAQADWDPRDADGYAYLVLRPRRVQAWREADEIPGRTLMRDGTWLS